MHGYIKQAKCLALNASKNKKIQPKKLFTLETDLHELQRANIRVAVFWMNSPVDQE